MEGAIRKALERIDCFISGATVTLPAPNHRKAVDALLGRQSASVRTAALFLMYYWTVQPDWNRDSVPVGLRGEFGDLLFCEELTKRNITLTNSITAYGENLGWKGDVRRVKLPEDSRFREFLGAVADAESDERERIADYMASRFAESKREAKPLPPVDRELLTFARAKELFHRLINIPSEGQIQQFVIAALLEQFRKPEPVEVVTHHPHAADMYDETAGDIEERLDGIIIRAYEVTVRPSWKERISNFTKKMDRFRLQKYLIIAAGVNADEEWSEPANLALRLEPYGRDIAVVDITDVVNFLIAILPAGDLREAVNRAFEMLSDRHLSGRDEFKHAYSEAVSDWLDIG